MAGITQKPCQTANSLAGKGGLANASRDARAAERKIQDDEKLPLPSVTRTQQSIEPACFRRPMRKDPARPDCAPAGWETASYYYLSWLVTCSFSPVIPSHRTV